MAGLGSYLSPKTKTKNSQSKNSNDKKLSEPQLLPQEPQTKAKKPLSNLFRKSRSEAALRIMSSSNKPSPKSPFASRHSAAVGLDDIKEETIRETESPGSSNHEDPILQQVVRVQAALDALNNNNSDHSISNTVHLRSQFAGRGSASASNIRYRSSDSLPIQRSLRELQRSVQEEEEEEEAQDDYRSSDPLPIQRSLRDLQLQKQDQDDTESDQEDTPMLLRSSDPLPIQRSLRSFKRSRSMEDAEDDTVSEITPKQRRRSSLSLLSQGSSSSTSRSRSFRRRSSGKKLDASATEAMSASTHPKQNVRSTMKSFKASSEAILDTVEREKKHRSNFQDHQHLQGHSSLSLLHLERAALMRDSGTANHDGQPVEKEISPSSTFHFRPRLEHALERMQQAQEAKRRQALAAMGLSVSTIGDSPQAAAAPVQDELPFEFEPDEEELERQAQAKDKMAQVEAAASAELQEPEDPHVTACQVAKQQHLQDFEHSRIQDLSHKFPLFDLDEVHLGVILGKGSFAQVIEVKGFGLKPSSEAVSESTHSVRNFTKSMRQKRRQMAGVVEHDSCSEADASNKDSLDASGALNESGTFEFARLKGFEEDFQGNDDDDDDGSVIEKRSKDDYGFQDITDDELEEDNNVDCGVPDEVKQIFVEGMNNRSLFQQLGRTNSNKSSKSKVDSSRQFIADHCHRAKEGEPYRAVARYALKQLKRKIKDDPHTMMQGIADMATETRVLSSLIDHPNLIKLRGIARGSEMPFQGDYFILLDRLYDTLEGRIRRWKTTEKKLKGVKGLLRDPKGEQRKQSWSDRVSFAFDLSSALAYLHSNHVMHRDLKPDNIGFDIRGDIKIFDFGLAKELPTINNGSRNLFHFTALCGSPRYMAPEVGMEEPYNELCDVYSFGVLVWQMMALKKPYGDTDMVGLISNVWKDDASAVRPSPSLVTKGKFMTGSRRGILNGLRRRPRHDQEDALGSPASLQRLLDSCWSYKVEERPSMAQVEDRLRDELFAMAGDQPNSGGSSRRLSHGRRRSTSVFGDEEVDGIEDPSGHTSDHHQSHNMSYNPLNLFRSNHSKTDDNINVNHESISSFANDAVEHKSSIATEATTRIGQSLSESQA